MRMAVTPPAASPQILDNNPKKTARSISNRFKLFLILRLTVRKERVRGLCPHRHSAVFGHFIGSLRCPRGGYRGVGTERTGSNLVNHHQFAEGKNAVPDPGTDSVESRRLQVRRREDQSLRDCAVPL